MLTDCLTCQNIDRCDQSDRWDGGCINYKMMPTKNPTNADKIRFMTDEELAEFMNHGACPPGENVTELCADEDVGSVPDMCNLCWLKWLREEYKSED